MALANPMIPGVFGVPARSGTILFGNEGADSFGALILWADMRAMLMAGLP